MTVVKTAGAPNEVAGYTSDDSCATMVQLLKITKPIRELARCTAAREEAALREVCLPECRSPTEIAGRDARAPVLTYGAQPSCIPTDAVG